MWLCDLQELSQRYKLQRDWKCSKMLLMVYTRATPTLAVYMEMVEFKWVYSYQIEKDWA